MKALSVGFIGGGRITKILLQGFKNKLVKFDSVRVYEPNVETLNKLKHDHPDIEKAATHKEAALLQFRINPGGSNGFNSRETHRRK